MFKRLLPALVAIYVPLLLAGPALAEPIGVQSVEVSTTNENGSINVQAGSHPYAIVTNFVLSKPEQLAVAGGGSKLFGPAGGGLKDVHVELPPGFVGNPTAVPRCSYNSFIGNKCPSDTAVGEAATSTTSPTDDENLVFTNAVYNLEPPDAVAVEFGYQAATNTPIFVDASVRTGGDYGIDVTAPNIPQTIPVYASKVTIFGVPGVVHCGSSAGPGRWETEGEREAQVEMQALCKKYPDPELEDGGLPIKPLLTNPTSCGEPRVGTVSVDSWHEPGVFSSKTATLPPLLGCNKLDFSPTITATPDGTAGSTPTGLDVDVHVPQESTTNPEGLGEADVRDTTVALPAGVQISPSASDGLQACSPAQIGFKGVNPVTGVDGFTPRLPGSAASAQAGETEPLRPGVNFCPDASKIGNVRIKTPLLEGELTGAIYLAAPQNFIGLPENPFSSLIAMYLVAEEPTTGVLVKSPGKVSLNETTGQITTTFENTPELPYSEVKLEFYGTDRAPLTTPALCGTYNTESSFTPWSLAEIPVASEIKHPAASFQVTSGPNGKPCSDPLPFSPTLDSGTTNINAGSYSELDTTLSRQDGQQSISSVQLHYPTGVSGLLTGVKLCGEQQANEGTCGPESLIGESIVSVGLGNDPYTVTGGKVYITGPYRGAPFGLSIVNPAKAGPYVLQEGRPVVVRAKIEVDPHTAALTVTTDPPGTPHAIPTIIEGIPLNIKHVNVLINRPQFTFNPTDCAPQTITSTIDSAEGASAPASIPFQVTNCGDLKFAPKFSVSTSGKTSRADGESLAVKLTYPNGPGYSNISKVKVELPKGLPSRLSTLQKACTAAQFNANPAGCPAASLVGYAKAITPLIPVPLEGPAYFVSNGAEAFPNLIVVLQGYGVTIDLVGDTFISKSGVTSSTFKTVPDAPVGSFELTLPEGPYSALTTDGNPCTNKSLTMPTEFVAQDGTTISQSTKIAVTGCPKAKVAKRHHEAKRRRGRGKAARGGKRTGRAGR